MERQWRAVKDQTKAMRDSLYVAERAYVDITGLSIEDLIVGSSPTLVIKWCNAGKTPAWHFYCYPFLVFGDKKPEGSSYCMERDVKGMETVFIGAGKEVTVGYKITDLKVTEDIMDDIENRRKRLFVSYHALYVDVYGERRLINSQAVYEPETDGFTDCYDDY